jgi:hypothetical protein
MKLLISLDELKKQKLNSLIPLECKNCGTTFFNSKDKVVQALKGKRSSSYCSQKCWNSNRGPRTVKIPKTFLTFNCGYCGKSNTKYIGPKDTQRNRKRFCNKSCRATYYNNHKTKGCRRSKLEKWIEEQLTTIYPNLEICFNQKTAINSELDIFVPSLKLAFELNGIFHYEPIFSESKLSKVKTNDDRKFQACLEKGIELCVIDVSSMKHLKKDKAQKFLSIITSLINKKVPLE